MIQHLHIKDFVLIQELDVALSGGFTAITGETGAGKSMLIGAISLILGARADSRTVREGCTKAIVEAECDVEGIEGMRQLFADNDLDYSPSCILRRELTSTGKSRAFVNDSPVSLGVLKQVGSYLVDIHSQHNNMLIGDPKFQMSIIDTLADNRALREEYAIAYDAYHDALWQLKEEQEYVARQKKEEDYISFQYRQLEEANLKRGEMIDLENRLAVAQHAQEIAEALHAVTSFVEDESSDGGVIERVGSVCRQLSKVSVHYSPVRDLYDRLESLRIELGDIVSEADALSDTTEVDPDELPAVEFRLDLLQNLMVKHGVTDTDELISLRDQYADNLMRITHSDERLMELEKAVAETQKRAQAVADMLTDSREKAAQALLPDLHVLMDELGIAGATFRVDIAPLSQLTPNGVDSIQFLLATNKKTTLQPISEIASGGEISRFMLALKTILAERAVLPTVIFDEIDTGVGGEIAEKLGRVMSRLSRSLQVLTITHLPQIAAMADHQLVVFKADGDEGFRTHLRPVDGEDRVHEIAGMLSGARLTDAAVANARALLQSHQK